ncbi:tetratricopeptide repeat protein, partial [Planktothrix sp.]|uniref:tetratricopeptide repeat protein n=1 Tax=Planktothrix sp. TaxID=3088171 RepID=UPI0038D408D2
KLQRIQADLERSKVFVQAVKTDLQNREQLNNQYDGTVIVRGDGMIARNPDFYWDRHNLGIEPHERPSISFNLNNLEVYKKRLELQPNDINLLLQYGQELINHHEWEDAIATYQILVERQPNAQSYQGLGDALQGKEVFDQAIQAYRKAIEFNPENPHIYNNLGDALAKLGQIEEASAWYRCATELASKQKTFLV